MSEAHNRERRVMRVMCAPYYELLAMCACAIIIIIIICPLSHIIAHGCHFDWHNEIEYSDNVQLQMAIMTETVYM